MTNTQIMLLERLVSLLTSYLAAWGCPRALLFFQHGSEGRPAGSTALEAMVVLIVKFI